MDKYAQQPRDRYKLTLQDINQSKRPCLAKAIKSSSGMIYALTEAPAKRCDEGKRLIVMQDGATAATLIIDEIIDGQENYKTLVLPADAVGIMGKIVMQERLFRLESQLDAARHERYKQGGRPRKYFAKDSARVIEMHEGGMSIRKIAKALSMSPTTVQKLLKYKDVVDSITSTEEVTR